MNTEIFLLRLAAALVLGALIGLERQLHHRTAGTRTNGLVAAGSAAFVMMGMLMAGDAPARIAAQIVSGIGFLGAGVILKEGANVRGLNTAATVWCSAAIGTLAGAGYPQYSAIAAVCVVIANVALRPLTYKLNPPKADEVNYEAELICRAGDELHSRTLLLQHIGRGTLKLHSLNMEVLDAPARTRIAVVLEADCRRDDVLEQLVTRLLVEDGVTGANWRVLAPRPEPKAAAVRRLSFGIWPFRQEARALTKS